MAAIAEPNNQSFSPSVQRRYDIPQLKEDILQISIYSPAVALQDPKDILCGICGNICNKPMDVGCKECHLYCNACLQEYMTNENAKKGGQLICISCNDESVKIDKQNIKYNGFAEKSINKLKVQCPYSSNVQEGPKTKGGDIAAPEEKKKDNYDEGMNVEDTRQKSHFDQGSSQYCSWVGTFGELFSHVTKACKFRKMFNKIECQYYQYGCTELIKESEMDKHMRDNAMRHLELKMDYNINNILNQQLKQKNKQIEVMEKKLNMQERAIAISGHEYLALTSDSVFTAFSGQDRGRGRLTTKLGDLGKTSRKLAKYRDHEIHNKLFPSLSNVSHDLHVFYKMGGDQNFAYCLESEDIQPLPSFAVEKDRASSLLSKTHGLLEICGITNGNNKQHIPVKTVNYLVATDINDEDDEKKEEFDLSKDEETIGKGDSSEQQDLSPKYSFEWATLTEMTEPRFFPGICEYDNNSKLCVIGGDKGMKKGYSDAVEIFDYQTKKWTSGKPMLKNAGRRSAGCCYWKEKNWIVVGGGYDGQYSKKVEAYDLQKDKWIKQWPDTKLGHAGGPNMTIRYDWCNNGVMTIGGILSGAWQDYIEFIDIRDNKAQWTVLCDIAVKAGYKKSTLNYTQRRLQSLFNI